MRFQIGTIVGCGTTEDGRWHSQNGKYVLRRDKKRWSIVHDAGRVEEYFSHLPVGVVDVDVASDMRRIGWKILSKPARKCGYRYYKAYINYLHYRVNRLTKAIECGTPQTGWLPSAFNGDTTRYMRQATRAKRIKASESFR